MPRGGLLATALKPALPRSAIALASADAFIDNFWACSQKARWHSGLSMRLSAHKQLGMRERRQGQGCGHALLRAAANAATSISMIDAHARKESRRLAFGSKLYMPAADFPSEHGHL